MGFAPKGGATARKEWYDRNPITGALSYVAVDVAPHAATLRAGYTVPTGKKSMVVNVLAVLMRITAPTALGRSIAYLTVAGRYNTEVRLLTATVGATHSSDKSQLMLMTVGETCGIYTYDLSTGGTHDFSISAQTNEFDA